MSGPQSIDAVTKRPEGATAETGDAIYRRRFVVFLQTYFTVGIVVCVVALGIIGLAAPEPMSLGLAGFTAFYLLLLIFILRKTSNYSLVGQMMLGYMFLAAWLIITQIVSTNTIYALFFFPPLAGLLMKRSKGVIWMIAFSLWLVVLTVFFPSNYSFDQIIGFISILIATFAFLSAYHEIADIAERQLIDKESQLGELTEKLQQELRFAAASKKQLDALSSSLSRQNTKLSDSKAALMNLLEDARKLEVELKASKANVEQQIQDRTNELSLERARLASTLESLPIAVALVDKTGKVADANDRAFDLVGLPEQTQSTAASRKKVTVFIDKKLNLMKYIQQCAHSAACVMIPEVSYNEEFYKIALGPVESQDAQANGGVVVVIENITAQKLLERSKDEFLMIASHELRTPLTAIRGDAAVLSKYIEVDMNKKDAQELVQDIRGSSDRLLGVVNDYLELSSLEQGKIPFDFQRLDVVPLCKQIVAENRPLAREKKLKLEFRKPRNASMFVWADPKRVAQIVQNLLSNAIHYTQRGTVTLELSSSNEKVICRVRDTGVGISKLSQKNLFDKFNQAQENLLTRDPERSTGLGLYIAKLLVEKMQGSLVLESSVLKKGSVFTFSLPVYQKSKEQ